MSCRKGKKTHTGSHSPDFKICTFHLLQLHGTVWQASIIITIFTAKLTSKSFAARGIHIVFGYCQCYCIKVLLMLFYFVLQKYFTHLILIYHGGTRWCHLALTFRRCSKSLKCIFSSPDDSGPMHSFASASLEVPRRLSLKTTHSIVECFNISLPMLKTRASFHDGLRVFRLVVVFFFFIRLFMYVNDTFTKGSERREREKIVCTSGRLEIELLYHLISVGTLQLPPYSSFPAIHKVDVVGI